jgi:hypothetical protein
MMDELIRVADQIEPGLRDLFSGLQKSIRGVLIDVDDFWEFMEHSHRYARYSPWYNSRDEHRELMQIMRLSNPYYQDWAAEWDYRPNNWAEHCLKMGYPEKSNPIVIRVILKEDSKIQTSDLPRTHSGYPIIYEVRPTNRALVATGLVDRLGEAFGWLRARETRNAPSIGRAEPNSAGTLGGILGGADPQKSYLVTCAHVLGPPETYVYQPGPYEGKTSKVIARVKHSKIPNCGATDDPCSEPATPDAARVDLAVAELTAGFDSLHGTGAITTPSSVQVISNIRKNDRVSFVGKTRGRIEAKIGALTVWDQIKFTDGVRCFGRIFEVKSPTRQYVREELAYPGDSGSWITFQADELVMWYGMVISCDGGQAYACFADYILDECRTVDGGLKLIA